MVARALLYHPVLQYMDRGFFLFFFFFFFFFLILRILTKPIELRETKYRKIRGVRSTKTAHILATERPRGL